MSKWKIKSIKHSGTCGERGTERTEPYYLARNRCEVEFKLEDLKNGERAVLYYSPREDYQGNGILVSKIVDKSFFAGYLTLETENSIYEMRCVHDGVK